MEFLICDFPPNVLNPKMNAASVPCDEHTICWRRFCLPGFYHRWQRRQICPHWVFLRLIMLMLVMLLWLWIYLTTKSSTAYPQIPEWLDWLSAPTSYRRTQLSLTLDALILLLPEYPKTAVDLFPRTKTVQTVKWCPNNIERITELYYWAFDIKSTHSTWLPLSKHKSAPFSMIGSRNLMDLSHWPLGWRSG